MQLALETIAHNVTIVVIAHRLSTVRRADTIHVMERGRIVESGGYDELLARKGRFAELVTKADKKALMLQELIEELKGEAREWMVARAVWRFFPAVANGETILIDGRAFAFPRQDRGDGLCLSDYVSREPGDHVCLFAVTAGAGVREHYERYKAEGEYLKSHAIQALAIETAEAAAEWLHSKLRGLWGFPDDPGLAMLDRFRANYGGKRYSFGYPACPDLALQEPLFELIDPREIGIALTEGFMMEPEAAVSAAVFHHPDAKYFSVR